MDRVRREAAQRSSAGSDLLFPGVGRATASADLPGERQGVDRAELSRSEQLLRCSVRRQLREFQVDRVRDTARAQGMEHLLGRGLMGRWRLFAEVMLDGMRCGYCDVWLQCGRA